jgi:hypothetical protein
MIIAEGPVEAFVEQIVSEFQVAIAIILIIESSLRSVGHIEVAARQLQTAWEACAH